MGLKAFLEKRRHARVPGKVDAEFRAGQSSPVETIASNFSPAGLFVHSSDPPGEGTQVVVVLRPAGGAAIEVHGLVRWISRFQAAPGFGVELAEADAQRLAADAGYQQLVRQTPAP